MLDPIAEMLTRIRNAQAAGHARVSVRFSKLKQAIAQILEREGFVARVEKESDGVHETLILWLKYEQVSPTKKAPAIREITRISKQGRRIYVKGHEIERVKNGYGISIISTSQGLMTGMEAHKRKLGGEYVCKVW